MTLFGPVKNGEKVENKKLYIVTPSEAHPPDLFGPYRIKAQSESSAMLCVYRILRKTMGIPHDGFNEEDFCVESVASVLK